MACYRPLQGFRSRVRTPAGRRTWVSDPVRGYLDMPLTIPCGQCIGCRLSRSRQWAIRCMHEASLHELNCFVTLTYSDAKLPDYGSLCKRDFQLFMKRLRARFPDAPIRFFHCGEYGSRSNRPHYHALLFGFDFPDKVFHSARNGMPVWRSATLEELWPDGLSEIGSVTFESAAYVARYVVDKVTGEAADAHYSVVDGETGEIVKIEPEYCTMSRRPGIGRGWFEQFGAEVYPEDGVVVRGHLQKPPRYYDVAFELGDPLGFCRVRRERERKRREEENTPERLQVREQVAKAKLTLLRRDAL